MDYRIHNPNHNDSHELYQSLKTFPKIELHRHLEGSLRLGTMADIAREFGIDLPGYEINEFRHLVQMMPDDPPTADVFISKFETLRNFYRSPEIIDRVAYEAVADAAADGVVYMELRFTPIALARDQGFPLPDVADWVINAVRRAEEDTGIDVRLLVSMNRHESVELGDQFVDIAIANMNRGIVGVDIAGAENRFPATPFEPVFRKAREAGLEVTIHAGEWEGPANVVEAVDLLGASRIGHGVRILEDMAVVEMALERGIAFEVCMTSNLQSGVTPSLDEHPLRRMYDLGLTTTINTDDPSVSAIDLTDEFVIAVKHLGFTEDDLKQHVLNSAQVAFLTDEERAALVGRLKADFYPSEQRTTATHNNSTP